VTLSIDTTLVVGAQYLLDEEGAGGNIDLDIQNTRDLKWRPVTMLKPWRNTVCSL